MCVRKINSWDNFWKHQHWNCLALKTQTKSSKTTYSNCDRASKSAAVRSPSASLDAAMISLAIALTRAPFCLGLLFVPFSSRLGEEGRIMHGNNGAPLCQLAPIRRTYRLCQNRRRPNCSSMPLTWEGGEFHARGRNTAPLATQLLRRANKAGGGLGVFMVRRLMATWILLWRKCVCGVKGGGRSLSGGKGEQRGSHTPPQSHNNDLQQRGQSTTTAREQQALSKKQHVACDKELWVGGGRADVWGNSSLG